MSSPPKVGNMYLHLFTPNKNCMSKSFFIIIYYPLDESHENEFIILMLSKVRYLKGIIKSTNYKLSSSTKIDKFSFKCQFPSITVTDRIVTLKSVLSFPRYYPDFANQSFFLSYKFYLNVKGGRN